VRAEGRLHEAEMIIVGCLKRASRADRLGILDIVFKVGGTPVHSLVANSAEKS
jgi:hypothetical protein